MLEGSKISIFLFCNVQNLFTCESCLLIYSSLTFPPQIVEIDIVTVESLWTERIDAYTFQHSVFYLGTKNLPKISFYHSFVTCFYCLLACI